MQERRWTLWYWLGLASVAYLLPLVVIVIDAAFFQSRVRTWVGPEIESVLDNVYWPVIVIFNLLFGSLN